MNLTIGIYYVLKSVKITLQSNIVTLQSKNKNNAFKAEVIFTKLKMKIKNHPIIHFTVSAFIQILLLIGLTFYIRHIYCLLTTNILSKCIF